ncbi:MAG: HAD-IB family hydrolase [Planctomycetota bacterium]|nr:MAG: HAD-IB family hydrolase [Planctomycetota bacterium]
MKVKAAIFDIDKTITTKDTFYLFFKFLPIGFRPFTYSKLIYLFIKTRLFKTDRIVVKKTVLELLNGLDEIQSRELCIAFVKSILQDVISNEAIEVLSKYRSKGYKILLISASLEVYLKHLDVYLDYDELICTKTKVVSSKNFIDGKNCYSDEKVVRLNDYLKSENIDLDFENSHFYTDHHSDLPLLYLVGHPHVVNGNAKLLDLAKLNNWPILNWR